MSPGAFIAILRKYQEKPSAICSLGLAPSNHVGTGIRRFSQFWMKQLKMMNVYHFTKNWESYYMKTLIIYATTHGCTQSCAEKLKAQLAGEVDLVNLKGSGKIKVDDYDRVMVGGSIHAGKIQGRVSRFCTDNLASLLKKKTGLFLCCMEKGEKAQKQFEDAFPAELRRHASASGLFGGGFDFSRMNWIEKAIIKKVAHVTESVSNTDKEAIARFAREMA
jgi:menaquinone-dependent protoporphyrinogen oxidase